MREIKIYVDDDGIILKEGSETEEIGVFADEIFISFGDGTVLSLKEDSGNLWRFREKTTVPDSKLVIMREAHETDCVTSDIAVLSGKIDWFLVGSDYVNLKGSSDVKGRSLQEGS